MAVRIEAARDHGEAVKAGLEGQLRGAVEEVILDPLPLGHFVAAERDAVAILLEPLLAIAARRIAAVRIERLVGRGGGAGGEEGERGQRRGGGAQRAKGDAATHDSNTPVE